MAQAEPGPEMLVDIVDDQDNAVDRRKRSELFKAPGGFRTVHAFIFNSQGKLLLQQQSQHRCRGPLTWGSSVAGYLFAGETYEEAIRRRIRQELGITVKELRLLGVVPTKDLGHNKFVGLYMCESDGPFQFDETHIEQLEFASIKSVERSIAEKRRSFTTTFLALWTYFQQNSDRQPS